MPQILLFNLLGVLANGKNMGIGPSLRGLTPIRPAGLTISGVTKDETGAATGGFTVYLFNMSTGTPVLQDTTVSDASGNYSFSVGSGMNYWAVDYKSGSPDKAGATLNTLVGI